MCEKLSIFAGAVLIIALTTGPAFLAQAGEHCQERTGESGYFNKTIDSGGWERNYILYVPPGYRSKKAMPLVFNFHALGGGWTSQLHNWYTRMDLMADKYKFILVTPQGLGSSWNVSPSAACCGVAGWLGIDDVGFVSDMIDQISSEYCIDQDRIYATGWSNGGAMAWYLGCVLGDRIAAIAEVSSAMILTAPEREEYCALSSHPVSVLAIHGTADYYDLYYTVPPAFGEGLGGFPASEFYAASMCTNETEVVYAKGDVTCSAYTECLEHGRVEFCSVEGGGHNWPGPIDLCQEIPSKCWYTGYMTQDIDASRAIAKFFKKHRMRGDDTN